MQTIDLRGISVDGQLSNVLPRPTLDTNAAVEVVQPILEEVREQGAGALYDLAQRFDKVRPQTLRVPTQVMTEALDSLDQPVLEALQLAIEHVRAGHQAQMPAAAVTEIVPGGMVYQRWVPLRRVGLYVPGGLVPYPSSVVMNVVAAQVAGVDSIVVASPPQAKFGGYPHPTVMAACALLGVEELIAVGGAQAIGAMAYGFTDGDYQCRPVDKVTGPGNIFVAAAKRCVQEVCGIDAEAGTTEIAILADETANPDYVAADLISQAEHDPAAASVLVTDCEELAKRTSAAIERQVSDALHAKRIATALNGPQSGIVLVSDLDQGEAVIEAYAPEHLEVLTTDAEMRAFRIRNAGAIFVGEHTPVPLGDYLAGSNHVLPTGGTARYASGLNSTQYLRSVQVIEYQPQALEKVKDEVVALAGAESLEAHGRAVTIRVPSKREPVAPRLPFREDLQDVEPYGAPQLDVPVRLNVNENPYPPDETVIEEAGVAFTAAMERLNRYADRDALELRQSLCDYLQRESGVTLGPDWVWAANGSNEIMLQLLQAFGGPGRVALGAEPTYSMYHEYARDTFTQWISLPPPAPRTEDPGKLFVPLEVERIIAGMKVHRPAVLFLPNPNNPTGGVVSLSDIRRLAEAGADTGPFQSGRPTATMIVVDEAYGEFRDPGVDSAVQLVAEYPNLVVTRTMSKAFAAAGLRLGYLIAQPTVVHEIQKVRLPYHLSLLTQAVAQVVLSHAERQLAQVGQIRQERDRLAQWLSERGYQVSPSGANFLLFGPLPDRERTWRELVDRGVLVRVTGPEGCLRVTVGTPEQNSAFETALVESGE